MSKKGLDITVDLQLPEISEIDRIKRTLAYELSKLDFDSLIEVEVMIEAEKRSRPEELY